MSPVGSEANDLAFEQWLSSPLGQRLLTRQRSQLEDVARRFHGEALLWCGPATDTRRCTDRSMVRTRLYLPESGLLCSPHRPSELELHGAQPARSSEDAACGESLPAEDDYAWLRADVHALPLRSRSISGIVLHHTLDRVEDPRHALREVVRVLDHGGVLVICGLNPYSLWGARRLYAAVRHDAFSGLNFVAPNRLHDWLTVLGMDSPRLAPTLLQRPPFATRLCERFLDGQRWNGLRDRLNRLPLGGCYVMTAVKSASAGRLRWREELTRRFAPGVTAPKPVVRQLQPTVSLPGEPPLDRGATDDER